MYFLAIAGLNGLKPISRTLYPTKSAAEHAAKWNHPKSLTLLLVVDAEDEPGRSIARQMKM